MSNKMLWPRPKWIPRWLHKILMIGPPWTWNDTYCDGCKRFSPGKICSYCREDTEQ